EPDVLSGKTHVAGIRLDHAGDDLDQRRLARTVLAQHGVDLAALAGEVDALERPNACIALRDAGQGEKGAFRRAGILHGASLRQSRPGLRRAMIISEKRAHWVFFSLCAMISGAVKFTPQGVNWFGAKKFALRSGQ